MDYKQLLPFLLKGRLGEREKAILNLTQNPDPAAIGSLLTTLQEKKTPHKEIYATFKKIIPSEILGRIIKYFNEYDY